MLSSKGTSAIATPPPSSATSATTTSAGLTLPSKNEELKRQEHEALYGQDLLLKLKLPDGKVIEMNVKESNEVGYVKLLLAERCEGIKAKGITLMFNNKELLDPMSLCDTDGIKPPGIEIDVLLQK